MKKKRRPKPDIDEETFREWKQKVGQFILTFGDIENFTYLVLFKYLRDDIFKTTATLNFTKRADLVIELINGYDSVEPEIKEQFAGHMKAAKRLAETRNTVAHSPMMASFYSFGDEEWTPHQIGLGSVRNRENPITLERLTEAIDEVEKIKEELGVVVAAMDAMSGVDDES